MNSAIRLGVVLLATLLMNAATVAQPEQPKKTELGSMPPAEQFPKVEFAFEERVTLGPAVVLGDTDKGHRQFIPITGGTIAGPKLQGKVRPGGWDYQGRFEGGCLSMSADYFLEANDGTVIRILNESFSCGFGTGQRSFFRPIFDAPKGPHDWLNKATFVATLEMDMPPPGANNENNDQPRMPAIRIKFYQIK